jgi:vacuolar-type H+-ATPase catalytic subunit A/Vma1
MEKKTVEIHLPRNGKRTKKTIPEEKTEIIGSITSSEIKEVIQETIRSLVSNSPSTNAATTRIGARSLPPQYPENNIQDTANQRKDLIKRSEFLQLKSSLKGLENDFNAKFSSLEHNVTSLKSIIDDLQRSVTQKNEKWELEFKRFSEEIAQTNEKERSKTNKTLQKIYSKHESDISDMKLTLQDTQQVSSVAMSKMQEDLNGFAKQISKSKDRMDNL